MGWSPDGKHLLFASDRNGSNDLWALPFFDRRPAGPAELVKANIGNAWSMGVTAAGALHMGVHAGDRDIEIASIDLSTGKAVGGPVNTSPTCRSSRRQASPRARSTSMPAVSTLAGWGGA
jgi:Tol biopolymer transport system component